ncbi:hypothetical protein GCM10025734_01970 [Kitasatospora paranensis]|uniref:hypothetical protein n=1 Tax=Kitasatospora paranensis TaxID=258053 RepID=UPI0031EEA491
MEQSSSLPQAVIDGIRDEFRRAGWLTADYGLASHRKRAFMLTVLHLDLSGTRPVAALPTSTAAQALNSSPDIKIRTKGKRITPGGNGFPSNKPGTMITGKIRARYPVNDPHVRFALDEAAPLPGYPATRLPAERLAHRSVPTDRRRGLPGGRPPVIGTLIGRLWKSPLRHYLSKAHQHRSPSSSRPEPACTSAPARLPRPVFPTPDGEP